jgi:hypothetical protein
MRIFPTKRVLVRWAIGLAILFAVALIVNGFFAWRAEWRLRSALAKIRAAGEPASIADLQPQPIPDAENAAAVMAKIQPRLKDFSKEHGRFFNTPIGKAYDAAGDRGEPASKEQIEAIRAILDKYQDVEQAITAAAACEQFGSQFDFSVGHTAFIEHLVDSIQYSRTAARFLGWRTEVLLADGRHEAAIQNGIQALRLARLHDSEPTLVAYLVAIAMRGQASNQIYDALAAGSVSPEVHAAIDLELTKHDDPSRLGEVLKSERAICADWINDQLRGHNAVLANVFGGPLKSMQVGVLDAMEEILALSEQPWHKARSKFTSGTLTAGHGTLAVLLEPALQAAFEANARSLAVSRALRINNALRQFADKNGREAKGLEELSMPREATIDPYSGEPLKLKHSADGWIIYSVMQNGKDDGGDFDQLKDWGVAPARHRVMRSALEEASDSDDETATKQE